MFVGIPRPVASVNVPYAVDRAPRRVSTGRRGEHIGRRALGQRRCCSAGSPWCSMYVL